MVLEMKRKILRKGKIIEIRELGKSLGGLNIPLLVITNFNCSKDQLK